MKALETLKPVQLKEQFQCDWSIWDFVLIPLRSHMDPSVVPDLLYLLANTVALYMKFHLKHSTLRSIQIL